MSHLVRISDELFDKLSKLAEADSRSVTNYIEVLLRKSLDND